MHNANWKMYIFSMIYKMALLIYYILGHNNTATRVENHKWYFPSGKHCNESSKSQGMFIQKLAWVNKLSGTKTKS